MTRALITSPRAAVRVDRAAAWLAARGASEPVLVVGATAAAAAALVRTVAAREGAAFGWQRTTLGRLAKGLAAEALASRGLAPVGALALEALDARAVARVGREGGLGRFGGIADRPGFPRALARTIRELRLAGASPERVRAVSADLARLLDAYEAELREDGLADRATVLGAAARVARESSGPHPLLGLPLLLLDLPIRSALERDLVAAVAARAPDVLATVPAGDEPTLRTLGGAIDAVPEPVPTAWDSSLGRLQAHLFEEDSPPPERELGDDVVFLSAPGEGRECVELVRHVLRAAERGVPFDRIAIVLRSPERYRAHLEEALRRSGIPACFAWGTRRPDPSGRALLALLACAAEGLSARRFAEYLSLGEVPDAQSEDAPPRARDRFFAADEEWLPEAAVRTAEPVEDPPDAGNPDATSVLAGAPRAPRRWERLLVESAAIAGLDRWERRLAGLETELGRDLEALEDPDHPAAARIRRSLADLGSLRDFVLPLGASLEALTEPATWGEWIDRLVDLATRAIRRPERILSVLAELAPMSPLGPVDLAEVRLVLGRRLAERVVAPAPRRAGRVFVGSAEHVRGLAFDVVLAAGLAERIFPQKVAPDPLLRDEERGRLGRDPARAGDRILDERLALRLAVGAARSRVVLSYPRIDLERSRPRVPSFYCLEVLKAAEGTLPDFEDLARRAERVGAAHVGWPAPTSPEDAIDALEHDLALLRPLLDAPEEDAIGAARYLLDTNPHLGRALRFRGRRWLARWRREDGLVEPHAVARAALDAHAVTARSYSPTALQNFATCPYKFLLYAIHRLRPREEPQAIEEMDPLQRGSLVHDVQFELFEELRRDGLLPVTRETLSEARARLERTVERVAARYRDDLAPAIDRVWDDGVASVEADLEEVLRRASEEESGWVPSHFELSFGLIERRARDPSSRDAPAPLDCGIQLRGSVDLVEESRARGALRVTDYKTGKVRTERGVVVGGGETLQPVLYALALEKIFPDRTVESGRLYYCTARGRFEERTVPLDDRAREAAQVVADTIRDALARGFFPAAPAGGACRWCDYRILCGPHEATRTRRKPASGLRALETLRELA